MPLKLVPLTLKDLPNTAEVRLAAFDGTPARRALRPQGTTPETVAWYAAKHVRSFHEPHTHFVGIRDTDTGELLAYGEWQKDLAANRKVREEEEKTDEKESEEGRYSPGSNWEGQDIFLEKLYASERGLMGDTDYWHCHLLATAPKHQRRGAARMILQWGQARAAEDNLPAYLDSTADGRPVYDHVGFVAGPVWQMDLKPHGVDHLNLQWPMRWDPPSAR